MSHGKKPKHKKKRKPSGYEHSERGTKLNKQPHDVNVGGKSEVDLLQKLIEKYDAASNRESGWNGKQFVVSIITAILVFGYTTVAAWQGCSSEKAAIAAKEAADTAASQLNMSQRPWLDFDLAVLDVITIDQNGILLKVTERSTNYGHSPAIGVRYEAKIMASPMGQFSNQRTIQARDDLCEGVSKKVDNGLDSGGETIFPDKTGFTQTSALLLPRGEINEALNNTENAGRITPMIIVCMAYRSTYSKQVNHTAKVVFVFALASNGNPVAIIPKEGILKPNQFVITPTFAGSIYAD
jgi:hypothetical protein